MGDYLKEAYDNVEKPLRYKWHVLYNEGKKLYEWHVLYNGKVVGRFNTIGEMSKFYDKYKSVLPPSEKGLLEWNIYWLKEQSYGIG